MRLAGNRRICKINGRILLANLLQGSRSTFSCASFPSVFAFQEGMWDTHISALLGSPTVSGGFLKHDEKSNTTKGQSALTCVRPCPASCSGLRLPPADHIEGAGRKKLAPCPLGFQRRLPVVAVLQGRHPAFARLPHRVGEQEQAVEKQHSVPQD